MKKEEFIKGSKSFARNYLIICWNKHNPHNSKLFTKDEFSQKKPRANEIIMWNENERNEPFDEREFVFSGPTSSNIIRWNENKRNELIPKDEFLRTNPKFLEIISWNKNERNETVTLKENLDELHMQL